MSNLVCLHMIVKDEAERIMETLESVRGAVDSWCIVDTGSTDGTQAMIRAALFGVPGELLEMPIATYAETGLIDYAATRNAALELLEESHRARGVELPVFLLLLNGDDVLAGHRAELAALQAFARSHRDDEEHEGYHVRIAPPGWPVYDSLRFVRTAARLRYSMPTHEVLHGKTGPRVPGVEIVHFEDPEAKRLERWRRDAIVLESWLKEHPDDPRATFYLAQTFECLGDSVSAAAWYQIRSKLGGFAEEQYEAAKRHAQMLEAIGVDWPDVQQAYLAAHALRPSRFEALGKIAEHYAKTEQHALAYLFAKQVADAPVPERDLLHVDRELHTFRAPDLVATHAFYIGRKTEGRAAARQALRHAPTDNRLRRNLHFYAEPLHRLASSYATRDLGAELGSNPPGWTWSTPSVASFVGPCGMQRAAIVRCVNYRITPEGRYEWQDGSGVIHTRNAFVTFDEHWHVRSSCELADPRPVAKEPPAGAQILGLEDCRLFAVSGRWWASACVADETPDMRREQVLLELVRTDPPRSFSDLDRQGTEYKIGSVQLLRGPWSTRHQKNWKPLAGQYRWIYSTDPLHFVEPDAYNSLAGIAPQPELEVAPPAPQVLLGSSQAIPVELRGHPVRWLWIDHEVSTSPNGGARFYVHRFVLADAQCRRVLSMSRPFYFEQLGVEFCAGLAFEPPGATDFGDGHAVISYSVNDASAKLIMIPMSCALELAGEEPVI